MLLTLGTFAAGLLGHIVIFAAGPWLSLKTQAAIHAAIPVIAIHAAIPVILTAVKFVTLPLLLLAPFARRHPTFKSWESWSKANPLRMERAAQLPAALVKALFIRAKSLFRQAPEREKKTTSCIKLKNANRPTSWARFGGWMGLRGTRLERTEWLDLKR
jgi:hypothetical protein